MKSRKFPLKFSHPEVETLVNLQASLGYIGKALNLLGDIHPDDVDLVEHCVALNSLMESLREKINRYKDKVIKAHPAVNVKSNR